MTEHGFLAVSSASARRIWRRCTCTQCRSATVMSPRPYCGRLPHGCTKVSAALVVTTTCCASPTTASFCSAAPAATRRRDG